MKAFAAMATDDLPETQPLQCQSPLDNGGQTLASFQSPHLSAVHIQGFRRHTCVASSEMPMPDEVRAMTRKASVTMMASRFCTASQRFCLL